jgi:DNA-binding MarR family transcriptional regulator
MSKTCAMQRQTDLDAITDAVLGASRVLVSVASRSLADAADEVTLPQYRALVVLQSRGPQPAHALASELQIVPSSATRLCDRLVAKGLIAREPLEGNRRELRLTVTDAGARIVGAVSRKRRTELHQVVSAMDEPDREQLLRVLEAFNRAAGEVPENEWYLGWA